MKRQVSNKNSYVPGSPALWAGRFTNRHIKMRAQGVSPATQSYRASETAGTRKFFRCQTPVQQLSSKHLETACPVERASDRVQRYSFSHILGKYVIDTDLFFTSLIKGNQDENEKTD